MHSDSPTDPYGDSRLAGLYDIDNPGGRDHEFFRKLADERAAESIIDLGCGTGLLTVSLANGKRVVTGIDPSETMLDCARARQGGSAVEWISGDARDIPGRHPDLVIITGNAAQHIYGEPWHAALAAICNALRPGGTLAFDARNPAAREWEHWTESVTRGTRETEYGPLREWLTVPHISRESAGDIVTLATHNVFERTGEYLVLTSELAFRTPEKLRADLHAAGFGDCTIAGGWCGEPVTDDGRILVVTARR